MKTLKKIEAKNIESKKFQIISKDQLNKIVGGATSAGGHINTGIRTLEDMVGC